MSKYESPNYQIILNEIPFEIRKYEPFNTTSVTENNLKGYSGFGLLFSYISGNNQSSQKMSMTVPVINTFEKEELTMEFVVPSNFKDNIPLPNNQHLRTKHYPAHFSAVITFSGLTTKKRVQKFQTRLKEWIKSKGYKQTSPYRLARFNPPFSLPFLRRNEVFVDIEYQESSID